MDRANQPPHGDDDEYVDDDEHVEQSDVDDHDHDYRPGVKHYPTAGKQRKPRVPWSDAEIEFLIKKIDKVGCQWVYLEQTCSGPGERLYGRDQVAIKDKARNLMRQIINAGNEEEWLARHPRWSAVSVGSGRRGVHAYEGGKIVYRKLKPWERELESDNEQD